MNITDEFDEMDVEIDVAKLSEIADHHVAVMDGHDSEGSRRVRAGCRRGE